MTGINEGMPGDASNDEGGIGRMVRAAPVVARQTRVKRVSGTVSWGA